MENSKNQLAAKLKDANNVLVTVSTNPTVDQLSAAIGLTLFLSKLKKHATTVFSGEVPSTIEFLKPEEMIETNTDSLRDFIISLDKNKADKIRYKVEESMVKIFITPYRTSIGEQDLVFSQGDFNVDVVIALGVHAKEEVDEAITAHGRILHDATVATLNTQDGSDVGSLNWIDKKASSLCEMTTALCELLKANSMDAQIATALLTGIVAETERFSNAKTTSTTMAASAKLMAAGANQQLVATQLQAALPPEEPAENAAPGGDQSGEDGQSDSGGTISDDGSLKIEHQEPPTKPEPPATPTPPPAPQEETPEPEAEPAKPEPPAANTPPAELPPVAEEPAPEPPKAPEPEPEPAPEPEPPSESPIDQIQINDEGEVHLPEPPQIHSEHRNFLKTPPSQQEEGLREDHPATSGRSGTGDKRVMEPPAFGGKLNALDEHAAQKDTGLDLPAATPLLNHESGPAHKNGQPSAQTPPPGPPSPKDDHSNLPQPATPPAPELPKPKVDVPPPTAPSKPPAAPPPKSPKPPAPPTPPPYKDLDDKTLDDIEEKVDSPHIPTWNKLPDAFTSAIDHTTLAGIEEKVDSPHLDQPSAKDDKKPDYHVQAEAQVARLLSDKKLTDIEQDVDSSHAPEPGGKEDKPSALAFEAMESEPPESADEETSADGKDLDKLQNQVEEALKSSKPVIPEPLASLGSTGSVEVNHTDGKPVEKKSSWQAPEPNITKIDEHGNISFGDSPPHDNGEPPQGGAPTPGNKPDAPPPVPPPMVPPPSQ